MIYLHYPDGVIAKLASLTLKLVDNALTIDGQAHQDWKNQKVRLRVAKHQPEDNVLHLELRLTSPARTGQAVRAQLPFHLETTVEPEIAYVRLTVIEEDEVFEPTDDVDDLMDPYTYHRHDDVLLELIVAPPPPFRRR